MLMLRHPFKGLKRLLPKTLFARSIVILCAPLVLVQVITLYVYLDRHIDQMVNLLADDIAGDVATFSHIIKTYHPTEGAIKDLGRRLELELVKMRPGPLEGQGVTRAGWLKDPLRQAFDYHIKTPYKVWIRGQTILVSIEVQGRVYDLELPKKRLLTRTTSLVLMWSLGASCILLLVAIVFMRNQVRPLSRLARAAINFGKGLDMGDLKPEGASEIRQVGTAFNQMRHRIVRQFQQRTQMLAGVSHDLATPLTRMKLQLAIMKTGPDIQALQNDVAAMEHLIADYLAFARGEVSEPMETVHLKDFLDKVAAPLQGQGFNIQVKCQVEEFTIHPRQFNRCLTNLLINSSKYATAATIMCKRAKGQLHVVIEDNGPGIPEAEYDRVFEPFYRLDASRNTETGGSGLGLAIVREIVRQMGGKIRLGRASLGGLQVTITLP